MDLINFSFVRFTVLNIILTAWLQTTMLASSATIGSAPSPRELMGVTATPNGIVYVFGGGISSSNGAP